MCAESLCRNQQLKAQERRRVGAGEEHLLVQAWDLTLMSKAVHAASAYNPSVRGWEKVDPGRLVVSQNRELSSFKGEPF